MQAGEEARMKAQEAMPGVPPRRPSGDRPQLFDSNDAGRPAKVGR